MEKLGPIFKTNPMRTYSDIEQMASQDYDIVPESWIKM